jgi:hypothetical protein
VAQEFYCQSNKYEPCRHICDYDTEKSEFTRDIVIIPQYWALKTSKRRRKIKMKMAQKGNVIIEMVVTARDEIRQSFCCLGVGKGKLQPAQ